MKMYQIVQTDNYGGDYPAESFVTGIGLLSKDNAKEIAEVINKNCCVSRYWKVVEKGYVLVPGFEA